MKLLPLSIACNSYAVVVFLCWYVVISQKTSMHLDAPFIVPEILVAGGQLLPANCFWYLPIFMFNDFSFMQWCIFFSFSQKIESWYFGQNGCYTSSTAMSLSMHRNAKRKCGH